MQIGTLIEFIIHALTLTLHNQAVLFDFIAVKESRGEDASGEIVSNANRMSKQTRDILQRFQKRSDEDAKSREYYVENIMLKEKIASLKKQIEKLNGSEGAENEQHTSGS